MDAGGKNENVAEPPDSEQAPVSPPAGGGLGAAVAGLRRHWLFAIFLLLGAALRAVTQVAYRPALIFYDTPGYLFNALTLAPATTRPLGYPLFLRPLLELNDLSWVVFVQHILGLVSAVLLYVILLRLGVWTWLAALGAAALLLDGYQLNIEQWVLSDTLFEFLLVLGYALLLWRRPPGWRACLAAGVLFSFAVWVRFDGLGMIVPAAVYLLFVQPNWRRRVGYAAITVVMFIVPLVGYASWFDKTNGHFGLSDSSARFLYARVATFADCRTLSMPSYERALCPPEPLGQRVGTNCYAWCTFSPYATYEPPAGRRKDAVVRDFAVRVIKHQPLTYARTVTADFVHGFEWGRHDRKLDIHDGYWRFTVKYPPWAPTGVPAKTLQTFSPDAHVPAVHQSLTRFLREYQGIAYVQGPVLALGLVLGLAAAAGIGRARRSGVRTAALFLALGGLAVVWPAYLVSEFTWRYQIPLLLFYPTAGALGLYALLARRADTGPATGPVPAAEAVRPSGYEDRVDRAS